MEVPGKKIASLIEKALKKEIKKLRNKTPLRLTAFLVGSAADQLSYVKIKAKTAKRLGIGFELIHLKTTPSFEVFMRKIKEKSQNPKTTAIIIQQPLPSQLSTDSIYEYIPSLKEIEGHKRKSLFLPPIGLAVLTLLKYIYAKARTERELIVDIANEKSLFKKMFRNKRLILVGRGITGGRPIGKTLTEARINFININSQTSDPGSYYKEADVIITAVGKKIITSDMFKRGISLINVGLRREGNNLKGDYDEKDVKEIAGYYTTTPGGIGPIDVLYLYKNLVEASKLKNDK